MMCFFPTHLEYDSLGRAIDRNGKLCLSAVHVNMNKNATRKRLNATFYVISISGLLASTAINREWENSSFSNVPEWRVQLLNQTMPFNSSSSNSSCLAHNAPDGIASLAFTPIAVERKIWNGKRATTQSAEEYSKRTCHLLFRIIHKNFEMKI